MRCACFVIACLLLSCASRCIGVAIAQELVLDSPGGRDIPLAIAEVGAALDDEASYQSDVFWASSACEMNAPATFADRLGYLRDHLTGAIGHLNAARNAILATPEDDQQLRTADAAARSAAEALGILRSQVDAILLDLADYELGEVLNCTAINGMPSQIPSVISITHASQDALQSWLDDQQPPTSAAASSPLGIVVLALVLLALGISSLPWSRA